MTLPLDHSEKKMTEVIDDIICQWRECEYKGISPMAAGPLDVLRASIQQAISEAREEHYKAREAVWKSNIDLAIKQIEDKWKVKFVMQRCQDLDDGFRDGRKHGFVLGLKQAKKRYDRAFQPSVENGSGKS